MTRNIEKWITNGEKLVEESNRGLTVAEIRKIYDMANGDPVQAIFNAFDAGMAVGVKYEKDLQRREGKTA